MSVTFNQMKGKWRHRKTHKVVEVVSASNGFCDSLGLRHESGRQSNKQLHYFIEDYERIPATDQPMVAGSPCGCHAINIAQPVNFCPLHSAAEDMRDALRRYRGEGHATSCECEVCQQADTALAKAEGK